MRANRCLGEMTRCLNDLMTLDTSNNGKKKAGNVIYHFSMCTEHNILNQSGQAGQLFGEADQRRRFPNQARILERIDSLKQKYICVLFYVSTSTDCALYV